MMPRLLFAAVILGALYVTEAAAQTCTTPKPNDIAGQPWVCVNGGWLPPGHQDIPKAPVPDAPPPPIDQPAPKRSFWLGHRYTRGTTDISIVGTGQAPKGVNVLFAMCNQLGDGCVYKGEIRMLLANAESTEWTLHGPY